MHGRNGMFFEPLEEIRSRVGVVGRRYRRTQAAFMRCRMVGQLRHSGRQRKMSVEEKGRAYRCEEGVAKKERKEKMHIAAGKSG